MMKYLPCLVLVLTACFSLWWNISTLSSAPYTSLGLKWLLLCHYCRQTRLSKTSKMIKYEDRAETEAGQWLVTSQKHQKCYVRMCLQLNMYRVETRELNTLYPDKSLLIGRCCHRIQLDIFSEYYFIVLLAVAATQSFNARNGVFSQTTKVYIGIIENLMEQLYSRIINQVEPWPC